MQHQEGRFSTHSGDELYYQYWLPEQRPKAAIVLVHGFGEHCGRYLNLVERVVPAGYAIFGVDHIGHGKSSGERAYVENFEHYTRDLAEYLGRVKQIQPDVPLFLVGHSMGGLIAANFLLAHQGDFIGAVLSGSLVKPPSNVSPILLAAAKLLAKIIPRARLLPFDANTVSRDPQVVAAYVGDPLVYNKSASLKLSDELLAGMNHLIENAGQIHLPVLILHGGADRAVDPESSELLHELVSSEDKTLRIYDGLYHELYNEPEHPEVIAEVLEWLDGQLG
jgi:alpha-beta hydrolase superfamily lysophospholipase